MSQILLDAIKEAANGVMANASLCTWLIGEVTNDEPLEVTLENNKLVIPAECILLTKNTCEYTAEISVEHHTENKSGGSGDPAFASHNHEYKGRKKFLVHNGLQTGDKVFLLRETGGQRYIAIDRVYNPDRGCSD